MNRDSSNLILRLVLVFPDPTNVISLLAQYSEVPSDTESLALS